jgi:hypothetical protein
MNSNTLMNPAERDFEDFMQRGNDFFKIELLRQAKTWYQKALALNIEPGKVKHQIAECDRMLAYENKVVSILLVVTAVLLLFYFVLIK